MFEVGGAIGLEYAEGFARVWASALTILAMIIGFVLLAQALKNILVGTGYAVWTGIGAVGTGILWMILFSEAASWTRLAAMGLIRAGIIGLKSTS